MNNLALWRFATCPFISNNWWRKLVSSSPIIFEDNLETTSFSFFIADLNVSSCEFDSFTFKLLYDVILYWQQLNYFIAFNGVALNTIVFRKAALYKTITVLCEKSKRVFRAFSIIKNIVFPGLPKFAVKLICWIALGSVSRTCCLLKSILWNKNNLTNNQLCNRLLYLLQFF